MQQGATFSLQPHPQRPIKAQQLQQQPMHGRQAGKGGWQAKEVGRHGKEGREGREGMATRCKPAESQASCLDNSGALR